MSIHLNNKLNTLQESPGDEICDSRNDSFELMKICENYVNDQPLSIYEKRTIMIIKNSKVIILRTN